jgi:hypothetical protein
VDGLRPGEIARGEQPVARDSMHTSPVR